MFFYFVSPHYVQKRTDTELDQSLKTFEIDAFSAKFFSRFSLVGVPSRLRNARILLLSQSKNLKQSNRGKLVPSF